VEKLIESNELDAARASLIKTISALDKAAKKKVLHPNTVSRRKSRLMKKFNKIKPAAAAKPEAAKTAMKKKKSKA
jgi:small subunit ribosomal protein S20